MWVIHFGDCDTGVIHYPNCMGTISGKIQLFNAAYKLAWDLSVGRNVSVPGLGLRLSDAVRVSMRNNSDPMAIAEDAVASLTKS